MGSNMAITRKPITMPMRTIKIGSNNAASALTARSTSLSYASAIRAVTAPSRPPSSPTANMLTTMGGKCLVWRRLSLMLSPSITRPWIMCTSSAMITLVSVSTVTFKAVKTGTPLSNRVPRVRANLAIS